MMPRRTLPPICLVNDMEIKKREILFSVIIVLVMLTIGFVISGAITEYAQNEAEKYTTAVRIEDPGQFAYGMDTDFGNALVYGTIQAEQPVTHPELEGEYLALSMVKERYTMHTRTVTYTDSNGHSHTRTETYWSWDYADEENWASDTVEFLGAEFPIERFGLPSQSPVALKDGYRYLRESSRVRYYFTGLPAAFEATIHTDLRNGSIGESVEVFQNQTPAEVVEAQISGQKIPVIVFWVVWVPWIAVFVMCFLFLENRWLDDKKKPRKKPKKS